MKKIIDLKSERAALVDQMAELVKNDAMTEEQRAEWTGNDTKVKEISTEIETLERQEELNKMTVRKMENNIEKTNKSIADKWAESFKRYVTDGAIESEFRGANGGMVIPMELRADPLLTTSNTDIVNKTVAPVSVKTPAGLDWLRSMGATFDENLNGNYVLPSIATVSVGFVGEGNDTSTANVVPANITLTGDRMLGGNQSVSRQLLAQSNPDILAGVLKVIDRAMGTEIAKDALVQAAADAPTRISAKNTTSLTIDHLLAADTSINVELLNPIMVTTKAVKNYLRKLNVAGAGINFALGADGTCLDYPVFDHPSITANRIFLMDANDLHIGFYGPQELIVDHFTSKKSGKIEFQVLQLVDCGYANPASISIIDVSAGL